MFVLPDLIPIVSRVFMSGNKSPMIASAAMPHVMISKVRDNSGDLINIEAKRIKAQASSRIELILTT